MKTTATQWGVVTVACTGLLCVTALVMHHDLPLSAIEAAGLFVFGWFLKSPLATPVEQATMRYVESLLSEVTNAKPSASPLVFSGAPKGEASPGLAIPGEASDVPTKPEGVRTVPLAEGTGPTSPAPGAEPPSVPLPPGSGPEKAPKS